LTLVHVCPYNCRVDTNPNIPRHIIDKLRGYSNMICFACKREMQVFDLNNLEDNHIWRFVNEFS
jgi:hypothetical protein